MKLRFFILLLAVLSLTSCKSQAQNPCPHWYDKIIHVFTGGNKFYFQNPTNPCPQRTTPQSGGGSITVTITSVSPNSGPLAGGTVVTITGTNFSNAAVTFGGVAATSVTTNSATQVTATTPAGVAATAVDVVVTDSSGISADLTGGFTYLASNTSLLSVNTVGSGSVSSSPAGVSCPSNCNVSFTNGTVITLTETPGSGQTFSGWSGACTGTGTTCNITLNSSTSVTATFTGTVSGNCTGTTWTIGSQEPVNCVPYPNTLWNTPLPSDVMSHLYPNSDAIISTTFGGSIGNAYFTLYRGDSWAGGVGGGYGGNELFYCAANSSCPIYKVTGVVHTGTGIYTVLNHYFHLPKGKCMSGCSNCDQGMQVWDLSSDIDSTPGGRYYGAYHYSGSPPCLNNSCSCTTTACANTTPACQLDANSGFTYYADWDYPYNDSTPYGHTSGCCGSGDWSPKAGDLRSAELVAGVINHALGVNTFCLNSPGANGISTSPVFPATGTAIGCTFSSSLRPVNGNLVFLDKNYNCNSTSVAGWQRPVCVELQTYGAYQHDTGGSSSTPGFWVIPNEGMNAYLTASLAEPAMNWFRSFTNFTSGAGTWRGANGLLVITDSSGKVTEVEAPFFNLPGALSHLHIADSCIPIGLANLSSWNGKAACH